MNVPKRLKQQAGRYALVDGIPFELPIDSKGSTALVAAFPIDAEKAKRLLPSYELHPARFFGKAVLFVTVVNYESTDIDKYIEYIIAIGCTRGPKSAPSLLPFVF